MRLCGNRKSIHLVQKVQRKKGIRKSSNMDVHPLVNRISLADPALLCSSPHSVYLRICYIRFCAAIDHYFSSWTRECPPRISVARVPFHHLLRGFISWGIARGDSVPKLARQTFYSQYGHGDKDNIPCFLDYFTKNFEQSFTSSPS